VLALFSSDNIAKAMVILYFLNTENKKSYKNAYDLQQLSIPQALWMHHHQKMPLCNAYR